MAVRTQHLTSVTWNVNGIRKRWKLIKIFSAIKSLSFPDIICFQETHIDPYWEYQTRKRFHLYHCFFSHGPVTPIGPRRGVCLFVKKTVMFNIKQTLIDPSGRYILLKGDLNGSFFTFGSIYAPADNAENRRVFFNKLILLNLGVNHLILGDYNSVFNRKLDRNNKIVDTNGDPEFMGLLEASNSIDVWRHFHPKIQVDSSHHSYAKHRVRGPFSRLDHALITKDLINRVNSAVFISDFKISDHKVFRVIFDIGREMIGHDFKKIKPHIFSLHIFQEEFEKLWGDILHDFADTIFSKVSSGMLDINQIPIINGIINFKNNYVLQNLNLDHSWWQKFKDKIVRIGLKIQREETMKYNSDAKFLLDQLRVTKRPADRTRIEKQLVRIQELMSHKVWNGTNAFNRLKNETCHKDFLKLFDFGKNRDLYIGDIHDFGPLVLLSCH